MATVLRESLVWTWLAPSLLTLVLIGTWDLIQQGYAKPADAEPYHERVAEAVNQLPASFDGWKSETIEAQREAVQLLKPNVILSRRYHHEDHDVPVNLLLVHCKQARDMVGHYPPICYPSGGWTERVENRRRIVFEIGGWSIPVMEYHFFQSLPGSSVDVYVINTLLLPDGQIDPSMDVIRDLESDFRKRFFGSGQLQILIRGEPDPGYREDLAYRFVELSLPVIETVRGGVPRE
ncbi:exosortase-associated EpsI family protein [Mucisphaera calidilacus]|uniref:Methanolan biosynthesis EpsI domain-containing protein n=1 Tax=Mucisphaera calidilacus TaxID=2527982 RepID=A0A518BVG1_9BACT|nr:exosortase-associated EpsI family protein [Mucisphaera calidilacus]QDU70972.1 hypothetical protein Pan265_08160 [Mucisphaera calidilacus]